MTWGQIVSITAMIIAAGALGFALTVNRALVKTINKQRTRLESSHYPYGHFNDEGGCVCIMPCCVRLATGSRTSLRCVCRDCNEQCPALGRLGSIEAVQHERQITWNYQSARAN